MARQNLGRKGPEDGEEERSENGVTLPAGLESKQDSNAGSIQY
jgi:hypothetical protein